jgi:hypothetical protein
MSTEIRRWLRDQAALSGESRIAPFRSINDFFLDGTWNIPKFYDSARLNSCVINSFVYDQTNYFILVLQSFFLLGNTYNLKKIAKRTVVDVESSIRSIFLSVSLRLSFLLLSKCFF